MAAFTGEIKTCGDGLSRCRARQGARSLAERDPAKLPWKELEVDVALECTGLFTKRESAAKHLEAGAARVHRLGAGRRRRLHRW